eukprot:5196244-Ditylum_brightwellii.AAC.1
MAGEFIVGTSIHDRERQGRLLQLIQNQQIWRSVHHIMRFMKEGRAVSSPPPLPIQKCFKGMKLHGALHPDSLAFSFRVGQ